MKQYFLLGTLLLLGTLYAEGQGITFQYGKKHIPVKGSITRVTLTLNLNPADAKKLDSFLAKTVIVPYSKNAGRKDALVLKDAMIEASDKDKVDKLIKTGKLNNFDLSAIIGTFEDGDSLFILPFLGKTGANPFVGKKDTSRVALPLTGNPDHIAGDGKKGPDAPDGINLAELVSQIKIPDLVLPVNVENACCTPNDKNCCRDIMAPCDSIDLAEKKYANKILYLANKNLTVYFDKKGIPYLIGRVGANKYLYGKTGLPLYTNYEIDKSSLRYRRNISVPAGNPLSFEIININPDAFKVEITDTAIIMNNEADTLLNLLLNPAGGVSLHAGVVHNRQDSLRVTIFHIAEDLKLFFLNLQNASIYQHNALISRKIQARNYVDQYLQTHYAKNPAQSLTSFLQQELTTDDVDQALIKSVTALYNNLPATYYPLADNIPQVQGQFDQIRFLFNISARETTPYLSLVTAKDPHAIIAWPVGGFKIDVSSGLYYAPNLSDAQYSIRADSILVKRPSTNIVDSLVKGGRLHAEDVGKGEFGFSSYLHFYPKISPWLNIAGSIGAGISFKSKPQVRYFLGATVLLGKDNRIAFTGGWVLGNETRLSSQYSTISSHNDFLPITETSVQTSSKFVSRGFFGVSYNLPFLKKTKTVAPPSSADGSASSPGGNTQSSGKKSGGDSAAKTTDSQSGGTDMQAASLEKVIKNAKKVKIKN